MAKCNCFSSGQTRSNLTGINGSLKLIVDEDHDDIGALCGFRNRYNFKAIFDSLVPALARTEADNHILS